MLKTPLTVKRTLSTGEQRVVGVLAENQQGTFFQYDTNYIEQHASLSPFRLEHTAQLQKAPANPHYGLHGVFGDSLPDGWGLYLMDRVFRQQGYKPQSITALERLAYLGDQCFGALSYEPQLAFDDIADSKEIALITLGREAVQEFEQGDSECLHELMAVSGSGGARPKLNVTRFMNEVGKARYSTRKDAVGEKLLVKLTSNKFALQHYESLVEYLYMKIAETVGIEVPRFELIDVGGDRFWLQQHRFDCTPEGGRYHMLSASGLLDASFREPSLDYIELIKATRLLCGVKEAQKLVKRALFNFIMVNQDDHGKNFAFLADDNDTWSLSPYYDIVYSPSAYGQHMTAFHGNGVQPDEKALQEMARQAGFVSAKPLRDMLEEIYQGAQCFEKEAINLGVSNEIAREIMVSIKSRWKSVLMR